MTFAVFNSRTPHYVATWLGASFVLLEPLRDKVLHIY